MEINRLCYYMISYFCQVEIFNKIVDIPEKIYEIGQNTFILKIIEKIQEAKIIEH